MILLKQVTNNLADAFYGKEGFDRKEHVRLKRGQGTWNPVGSPKKVHQDEIDYGSIVTLDSVLKEIIDECNKSFGRKDSGTKKA